MSDLAETLEQMQYDILQGDLSGNPLLQPSIIASRDRELKTTAKKIIPAINELLKRINVCESTMSGFTSEVDKKLTAFSEALSESLTVAFQEEIKAKLQAQEEALSQKLEISYKAELQKQIEALKDTVAGQHPSNSVNGGIEMKKELVKKVTLQKNEVVVVEEIKQEELFPENIITWCGNALLEQGFWNAWENVRHNYLSSTGAEPIEIRFNGENIQIRNTAVGEVTVLIYKYV